MVEAKARAVALLTRSGTFGPVRDGHPQIPLRTEASGDRPRLARGGWGKWPSVDTGAALIIAIGLATMALAV
jgi:hypothetical protein